MNENGWDVFEKYCVEQESRQNDQMLKVFVGNLLAADKVLLDPRYLIGCLG
jgi:hypothetical protein